MTNYDGSKGISAGTQHRSRPASAPGCCVYGCARTATTPEQAPPEQAGPPPQPEIVEAAQWLQQNRNLSGPELVEAARQQNWEPVSRRWWSSRMYLRG